ncbi:MAG TPA: response regulator transcription factor [Terriglobales bacterium]|jgi:DNA-binding NarL/FixJ family response regulator|nr:response regulator transcription factor [Terriglobales bacterium]
MAATSTIGVFLLAENRLLREALTKILSKRNDACVVGAASLSPQVVEQVCNSCPDILISDSAAATLSGLEIIPEIRKVIPAIKVMMIGMDDSPETFLRAVKAGVVGYLLKDASATEVAAAVRAVTRGEAVCPPALCLRLFEYVARRWLEMPAVLVGDDSGFTRREQQLAQMIGQGLTNKEIATELHLSEQTVKNHIHRMLRKTGMRDRLAVAEVYRAERLLA